MFRRTLLILFTALLSAFATADSGDIQLTASAQPPHLVFACELDSIELQQLFADPAVVSDLVALHAGVALALQDMSPQRAAVVRKLNQANIPVHAWLALSKSEGYYLNAGNERQAAQRFADFLKWTAENDLHWAAIGLDIEPNIQEFAALRDHKVRLVGTLIARYFEPGPVTRARESYAALIRQMQSQGYLVETYQFPFIVDEREAHTTLLERLFGIVDVRGNQEVLMLYTSFHHSMDSALIWKYGPKAGLIAVGSTKSDPDGDKIFPPLSWDEFSRDVIVARQFCPIVGVYSLEGCVRRGFLAKLRTMDWSRPVTIPAAALEKANLMRSRIHMALWLGTNLPYIVLVVVVVLVWWMSRRRRRRRLAAGG